MAEAAEDKVLVLGQFGCAPGTEGMEGAEFTNGGTERTEDETEKTQPPRA